jgi:hypothetical protein
MRHQGHAEHSLGFLPYIFNGLDHFHATALAAATGMYLRLHHPDRAAQLLGCFHGLRNAEYGNAPRHRHAEAAQNFLGLVLVNVHRQEELKCAAPYQWRDGGQALFSRVRLRVQEPAKTCGAAAFGLPPG